VAWELSGGLRVGNSVKKARAILEAGSGSRTEAFGAQEWLLLSSIALIWGSSFLFTELALEGFRPGVIALARMALGVGALALFRAARRPVDRDDLGRVAFLGVIYAGLPLQQRYGALPVLLRAQLAALVLLLPFGLVSLPGSDPEWGAALALVPLGILGTGLAFVLMTTLVGRVGGPRGAVATYFIPVVAIALGVIFLNERVAPVALLGPALVLEGAWLTSRREVSRRTATGPTALESASGLCQPCC
jgi:drug/metabolite transporter (DMT)-like permease